MNDILRVALIKDWIPILERPILNDKGSICDKRYCICKYYN